MSAGIAGGTWLLGGAILGSAVIGSQASGDAATQSGDASKHAANLQNEQYQQTREDLAPYRDVATGQGGSLYKFADYGQSKVDPNIYGNIPQFDSTQFDIYKDPSYEWRQDEQDRAINRNMSIGKIASGNRLNEIMERSGKMASQEYGNAYGRMLTDYGVQRENENTQYGRNVSNYGRNYQQEGDYLNRLASLSNIGQSATNTGATAGANAAYAGGQAIQNAGNAQAAGTIGQANAISGAVGDMTSLYAMSQYGGNPYTNYGGAARDVNNMVDYSGLY